MSDQGRPINIAVVGATGLVGEAILGRLAGSGLTIGTLHAVASADSVGRELPFGRQMVPVEELEGFDFAQVELALFALPEAVAGPAIQRACEAGCIVIDNSSLFRTDPEIPLVAAAANPEMLADFRLRGIIALPGSEATLAATLLAPLQARWGLQRVDLMAMTSAAAGGRGGVEGLARETAQLLGGKPVQDKSRQRAFNLRTGGGSVAEGGPGVEEQRIADELQRLLGDPGLAVNPALVGVPLFFGEAIHLHLELQRPFEIDAIRELITGLPGFVEEAAPSLIEIIGSERILVGGLRDSAGAGWGLDLWLLADTLSAAVARNNCDVVKVLEKSYL